MIDLLGVVDGNLLKAVYLDFCNQLNYITIFLLGFGLTAADDHGMKEVIKRGRWFNLIIGKLYTNQSIVIITLLSRHRHQYFLFFQFPSNSSSPPWASNHQRVSTFFEVC